MDEHQDGEPGQTISHLGDGLTDPEPAERRLCEEPTGPDGSGAIDRARRGRRFGGGPGAQGTAPTETWPVSDAVTRGSDRAALPR
jgi:hypothetical protein